MKVAMLGVGMVGSALGPAFAAVGHEVVYGVRDPDADRHADLLSKTPGGRTSDVPTSVEGTDVAVLAVPWAAATDVVASLGETGGLVVADATNTLKPGFQFDDDAVPSGAAIIQAANPTVRVVKAFNTTGKENLADPRYPEGGVGMPICGDDDNARAIVADLASSIGNEVVDCGDLAAARALEHLAWLWIRLAIPLGNGRDVAFRLARR